MYHTMGCIFTVCGIGATQKPLEKDAGEKTIAWLDKLRNSNGSLPTSKIRLNMQRVMQNNAAVFRTQETLEEGIYPYYPMPTVTHEFLKYMMRRSKHSK